MIPGLKIVSLYAIHRSFDRDFILTSLASASYTAVILDTEPFRTLLDLTQPL